jgi:hypothetical protein
MMCKSSTINSWETTKVLLTFRCNFDSNSNEYGACDYKFDTRDGWVLFTRNNLIIFPSPPNHGPFDTQARISLDRVDDDGYELKLNFRKH